MADASLERRVEELESQMSFQDELIQQLSDVIARQDHELVKLQQQVKEVALRLAEARDATAVASSDPASEVPPHY